MKSRTITLGGLVIVIFLFAVYFLTIYSMEHSQNSISANLNNLLKYAQQEDWNSVKDTVNKLENRWNTFKPILTINSAEADYFVFIEYLGRIKGHVLLQEKEQLIGDTSAVIEIWDNLIKVVPQP